MQKHEALTFIHQAALQSIDEHSLNWSDDEVLDPNVYDYIAYCWEEIPFLEQLHADVISKFDDRRQRAQLLRPIYDQLYSYYRAIALFDREVTIHNLTK